MSSTILSAPYIVTIMVVVEIYPVLGIRKEGEGFKEGDKTKKVKNSSLNVLLCSM